MIDLRITPKPTASDEMRQAAVEVLREALGKAEAGNVDACLVILRHPGGRWSDERSGCMDFPEMVGRLEIVKQAWINAYLKEPG
jgi:hypothetical protein